MFFLFGCSLCSVTGHAKSRCCRKILFALVQLFFLVRTFRVSDNALGLKWPSLEGPTTSRDHGQFSVLSPAKKREQVPTNQISSSGRPASSAHCHRPVGSVSNGLSSEDGEIIKQARHGNKQTRTHAGGRSARTVVRKSLER